MPTNRSGETLNVAATPVRSAPSRAEERGEGTKEDSDSPQRVWMGARQIGREEHKAVASQDDLGAAHAWERARV